EREQHHRSHMQGRGPPQDRARDLDEVAQRLHQAGDRDEREREGPYGERERRLVEGELSLRRRGICSPQPKGPSDHSTEPRRQLQRERAQMALPLAAPYEELAVPRDPPVRQEVRERR